jgi:hypothetical protein
MLQTITIEVRTIPIDLDRLNLDAIRLSPEERAAIEAWRRERLAEIARELDAEITGAPANG